MNIKEQIEREAERYYNDNFDVRTICPKDVKEAYVDGASFALEMDRWVNERDSKPEFGVHVLCHCRIYGFYIGSYQQILDTGHGNWSDGKSLGILPPTHWQPLPKLPQ